MLLILKKKSIKLIFNLLIIFILIPLNTQIVSGQLPSRNSFNFIFENNFDDNQVGIYKNSDFVADWNMSTGTVMNEVVDIRVDEDAIHKKVMRGYYPKGTWEPDQHGFRWDSYFKNPCNELYFSFDIKYKPGFEWVLGGKMPGIQGGVVTSAHLPTPNDGFSARMMWKEDGALVSYVYHQDQPIEYGSTWYWGTFKFNSGQWYNVTIRVVLNSVVNGVGLNNGIMEGFVNGHLTFQKTNIKFRSLESIKIDKMSIASFFGGSNEMWAAIRDEWIDTDNYVAFTYASNLLNVPRGLENSSFSKKLIHPYHDFSDADWKKSLKYSSISTTSVDLSWVDYPVPTTYTLERQEEGSTTFTSITTLAYGIKSYSDKSLKSGTKYIYRLKAGNSISNQISITAAEPVIPNAPSALSSDTQTKSSLRLKWTDNATNEVGFRIYRSLSASEGFSEIATVSANITTYTANSLQPATTYYYKLIAYNADGSSPYTPVLSVTTTSLQIPAAPTGLIASRIDYTLATVLWTDNANNETGFELECSGPNNLTMKRLISLPANLVSHTDSGLVMNGTYKYRIRAKNNDGISAWSNVIEVVTPKIIPPVAPTKLKSTKFTETSISVSWNDNSNNEDAFIMTRSLAIDPTSAVDLLIDANDTAFTDTSLFSSTTYQYSIKAVNLGGSSSISNKNVATTLSSAEMKRVKEGLVSYYNFGYNPDYIIYDQSGYGDPVNLRVLNRSAISWNEDNTLDMLSNTAIVSMIPATKIVKALKSTNEITFECWLKPQDPNFVMDSRIVSLGNDDDDVGFLLDQNLSSEPLNQSLVYSVRMQTTSTVSSGFPAYIPDQTQSFLNLQHLVYTRNSQGNETLYLNGIKSSDGFRPSDLETWKDNYYLRLGNESDMNHAWNGSFYSVAIYNKALSKDEVMTNFTAGPCDSIQHNDVSYLVEVFPNPVSSQATLKLTPIGISDYVSQTSFRIINVFGEVVHQEQIFDPGSQYVNNLDVSKFTRGVYFLQVMSGKSYKSTKFVVQRP